MAKVLTIVGARPQFIKAAVVSKALDAAGHKESIVHTGQHYDYNMSQAFFDELSIPQPELNLGISGGTHAEMTARMLVALEQAITDIKPDIVLLYGDTNSTLAGALAAAKLHIPIAHVEAGTRTHSMTNPEEINRVCTDHVASLLLACTEDNLRNLQNESLEERSFFVGDPMYDAFLSYRSLAQKPELSRIDGTAASLPNRYYYMTCHREENTAEKATLRNILSAMDELDHPVIYPVHPRNKSSVSDALKDGFGSNVIACDPVGYLESIYLVDNAEQIVTDSGGLQREAFFAGKKCTTLLDFEVWPETMVSNRNLLAKPAKDSILKAMNEEQSIDESYLPFGDGRSSEKIANRTSEYIEA